MKGSSGFFIIVVAIVLVYVMFFLPQRRQQKARQTMMNQLAPGSQILTAGGIYAMVTEVTNDRIVARIGLDEGLLVELDHRAVLRVVSDASTAPTLEESPSENDDDIENEFDEDEEQGVKEHP